MRPLHFLLLQLYIKSCVIKSKSESPVFWSFSDSLLYSASLLWEVDTEPLRTQFGSYSNQAPAVSILMNTRVCEERMSFATKKI